MGEVARFGASPDVSVGAWVVVRSARGEEIGVVLGAAKDGRIEDEAPTVLRIATSEDREAVSRRRAQCEAAFPAWQQRIRDWQVEVELIDLEQTLDGKLVLYVLNDRGPETTKLALKAAAGGFGVIEVQPVGPEGLIAVSHGSGCGSCRQK